MKPLLQAPESERKNIFWISFIVIAVGIVVFWMLVFFRKDIERFQTIPLPDVSKPDLSEEFGSLKELSNAFKESVAAFQGLTNDIKSLGGDLTKEEEQKLHEWADAKQAEGKELTFEETFEFLNQLRGTGSTTMPIQK
jgi:hypothetical protein